MLDTFFLIFGGKKWVKSITVVRLWMSAAKHFYVYVVSPPSLSPDFWLSGRTLDWCARGCEFETRRSHNIWCQKCWLVRTPKHGCRGWYDIVDSMANGVGLPDLGIGWEVTCDVLSMRIPGSQEKREECSVAPEPESGLLA